MSLASLVVLVFLISAAYLNVRFARDPRAFLCSPGWVPRGTLFAFICANAALLVVSNFNIVASFAAWAPVVAAIAARRLAKRR